MSKVSQGRARRGIGVDTPALRIAAEKYGNNGNHDKQLDPGEGGSGHGGAPENIRTGRAGPAAIGAQVLRRVSLECATPAKRKAPRRIFRGAFRCTIAPCRPIGLFVALGVDAARVPPCRLSLMSLAGLW